MKIKKILNAFGAKLKNISVKKVVDYQKNIKPEIYVGMVILLLCYFLGIKEELLYGMYIVPVGTCVLLLVSGLVSAIRYKEGYDGFKPCIIGAGLFLIWGMLPFLSEETPLLGLSVTIIGVLLALSKTVDDIREKSYFSALIIGISAVFVLPFVLLSLPLMQPFPMVVHYFILGIMMLMTPMILELVVDDFNHYHRKAFIKIPRERMHAFVALMITGQTYLMIGSIVATVLLLGCYLYVEYRYVKKYKDDSYISCFDSENGPKRIDCNRAFLIGMYEFAIVGLFTIATKVPDLSFFWLCFWAVVLDLCCCIITIFILSAIKEMNFGYDDE